MPFIVDDKGRLAVPNVSHSVKRSFDASDGARPAWLEQLTGGVYAGATETWSPWSAGIPALIATSDVTVGSVFADNRRAGVRGPQVQFNDAACIKFRIVASASPYSSRVLYWSFHTTNGGWRIQTQGTDEYMRLFRVPSTNVETTVQLPYRWLNNTRMDLTAWWMPGDQWALTVDDDIPVSIQDTPLTLMGKAVAGRPQLQLGGIAAGVAASVLTLHKFEIEAMYV